MGLSLRDVVMFVRMMMLLLLFGFVTGSDGGVSAGSCGGGRVICRLGGVSLGLIP